MRIVCSGGGIMKIKEDYEDKCLTRHFVFEPGDGTCYDCILTPDPYGGFLVNVNTTSVWRWYPGDYLKFLCGNNNSYTSKAVFHFLENYECPYPYSAS